MVCTNEEQYRRLFRIFTLIGTCLFFWGIYNGIRHISDKGYESQFRDVGIILLGLTVIFADFHRWNPDNIGIYGDYNVTIQQNEEKTERVVNVFVELYCGSGSCHQRNSNFA